MGYRDKTTFRNDADAIRPERELQVKERKPAYGMWWWGAIGNLSPVTGVVPLLG